MKEVLMLTGFFDLDDQVLNEAGFKVVRMPNKNYTQADAAKAIKGKAAVVMGSKGMGTKQIFDAADGLEIAIFPGIGFPMGIPDWQYAQKKGIEIAYTPEAPTHATAEWCLMAALSMTRGMFEIGRTGSTEFRTLQGLEGQKIGIFSLGRIGTRIAEMVIPFQPASVFYVSRTRKLEEENRLSLKFVDEKMLFSESDIVFITAPDEMKSQHFNDTLLSLVKDGSTVVSISRPNLFDYKAVENMLKRGVKMAQDDPIQELQEKFGPEQWFTNIAHNASNTEMTIQRMKDTITSILVNFFETGKDKHIIPKQ